jgi:type IV pilus assembly protein PilM
VSESFWKKEISFGKKAKEPKEPVAEQPVEPAEPTSLWRKELSFGKKSKEPQPPKPAKEPKPESTPFWKKEISLGRKKEPVSDDAPRGLKEERQSIWKREVGLPGKKKDDDQVARLVELATRTVDPTFAPSPSPAPAEPVTPPTEIAEAVVAAAPPVDTAPSMPADIHPVEQLPVDEPVAPAAPLAAVPDLPTPPWGQVQPGSHLSSVPAAPADPVEPPVPPVASVPSEPVASIAAVPAEPAAPVEQPVAPVEPPGLPVASVPSEPVASVAAPVAAVPAQPTEPEDLHLDPAPVEEWMEPEPLESWLADAELPPEPEAETAVVLHPPVPAAELPELPDAKVPFWKKEIGRKAKAPKAPKAPKEPKAASAPFWKKELSFGRKEQAPAAELPEPIEPSEPTEPKVPFWKREIGGPKKAKEYEEPKAKRSFTLPELSLPSFSRGGGHQVKRLVGLKVGGSQLAAARIANNGAAELLQVARVDLPPGVVVSGELRDPDSLANALKDFFAKNKLPRKNVRLGIASNRIGVRTFEITGIDDPKQLENAIHFRAQEALPIPLDEAVLDYHVLEERADEEGTKTKRVLLVVAYRELVDRYVDACKKAGIVLSGIDLEAFALLRALSAPRPETEAGDSALVAVAIGHDRSTFAVSDGRVCDFTRVLEWGGSALNVAIARALDLAPSEAETIKRAVSLSSPDVPDGIAFEQYSLAVDAVRKQVHTFARELVSSLQFYQNQPGSLGIGEIVITGGTANLAGIADELQRLIGVRVRVGDPLARLKITKKLTLDEPMGSLAVAIGLGIED